MTKREHHLAIAGFIFFVVLILAMLPAHSRDLDGRYKDSQNHEWVKSLHSPAGAWCCDVADGEDAEWRSHEGRYQVKLRDAWLDVPEDAVITEPNKIGRTLVWFVFKNGSTVVNCFLPGSMT